MLAPQGFDHVFCVVEGARDAQLRVVKEWATMWLRFLGNLLGPLEPYSAIFDVDETLVDASNGRIERMYELYRACCDAGLRVYIVTARPDSPGNRSSTASMLMARGVAVYERLYMMPSEGMADVSVASISRYKASARAAIDRRHRIALNVGDAWSDHDLLHPSHALIGRSAAECAITFLPGNWYPSLKLPPRVAKESSKDER